MSAPTISAPLVGRTDELAALRSALAAVRDGSPASVLVGGEAGVGKTRLISEFAATEQAAGTRVLTGGCLELSADGLPFAPFTAVLRQLVRELGADGLAALLPGGTTASWPGCCRSSASRRPPRRRRGAGPAVRAGAGAARAAGRDGPDRAGHRGRALGRPVDPRPAGFLIRNLRALDGVLVVVTYRSDELHRSHPLRPLLAELDRVDWVSGSTCPADPARGRRAGPASSAAYPTRPGRPALRAQRGQPAVRRGPAGCQDTEIGELPESLRDLVLGGVRRLPEETQEMLRMASAGGRRVGHALLAAVSGLDDRLSPGAAPGRGRERPGRRRGRTPSGTR